MFDISFFELAVIGAVALVVIGPERLPQVARTVGRWIGKIQRYVSDVKADINREMELEELRRLRAEMNETARSVEATARSMERSLREQAAAAEEVVKDVAADGTAAPGASGVVTESGVEHAASLAAASGNATVQNAPASAASQPEAVPANSTEPKAGETATSRSSSTS